MLRIVFAMMFMCTLLTSGNLYARTTTSTYGQSYHKYYTGVVQNVYSDGIVVDGQTYSYASDMKIKAHNQVDGAFDEVEGRLSEVRVGVSVVMKLEGTTIHEIIIERWKQ